MPKLGLVLLFLSTSNGFAAETWRAGLAAVDITPAAPMWMSGYAARKRPAEGKLGNLYAKAVALEDPAGKRAVFVAADLVGIDRAMSLAVCSAIVKQTSLDRASIVLAVSHTHSGPVVRGNLMTMYALDAEQSRRVEEYGQLLREKLVAVAAAALADLKPARLQYGNGHASFATNRRNNPEGAVPKLRAAGELKGPVDHDVPVLSIRGTDGVLRGVLFGYACHATVLDGYLWSGDYPGAAQAALETRHSGALAVFWAGCGADQNPIPRRHVPLVEQFGNQLATSVDAVLDGPMAPVEGTLRTAYREIDLAFDKLPDRAQIEADTRDKNRYTAARAKCLLERIEKEGSLSPTYPYPVQGWALGNRILCVTLGGEVVVDYALRLKRELPPGPIWAIGYANDVMAYIPSLRVLREGGYEGGGAMVYYGQPASWSQAVEETIITAVKSVVKEVRPVEARTK